TMRPWEFTSFWAGWQGPCSGWTRSGPQPWSSTAWWWRWCWPSPCCSPSPPAPESSDVDAVEGGGVVVHDGAQLSLGHALEVALGRHDLEIRVAVDDAAEDQQQQGLMHLLHDTHQGHEQDARAQGGVAPHGPGEDVERHRHAPLGEGRPHGVEALLGVVALG